MNPSESIIALSTAQGEGAISVIRLSGSDVIEVVNRFCQKGPFGASRKHPTFFQSKRRRRKSN